MHEEFGLFLGGALVFVVELLIDEFGDIHQRTVDEDLLEEVIFHLSHAHKVPFENKVKSLSAERLVKIRTQRPEESVANDPSIFEGLF